MRPCHWSSWALASCFAQVGLLLLELVDLALELCNAIFCGHGSSIPAEQTAGTGTNVR